MEHLREDSDHEPQQVVYSEPTQYTDGDVVITTTVTTEEYTESTDVIGRGSGSSSSSSRSCDQIVYDDVTEMTVEDSVAPLTFEDQSSNVHQSFQSNDSPSSSLCNSVQSVTEQDNALNEHIEGRMLNEVGFTMDGTSQSSDQDAGVYEDREENAVMF